jgi:protease-4
MSFAGKVWRLLVGIKDALALLFLLLFFVVLFAALGSRPSPAVVRDGALLFELDGMVVEEKSNADPFEVVLSGTLPDGEYAVRDIVRAIDAAAGDKRIKAIAFDLSSFLGGGQVHMQEIAGALDRFRRSGKKVLTYALAYGDDALTIAAHSDEAWVDPLGGALILGPGGERLYYAGLLERFDVNARVYRVGSFKSAVEPYMLSGMSDEARENAEALYQAMFEEYLANISKGRPGAKLDLVTQDVPGWIAASNGDLARASVAAGLVDKIGDRTQFGERMAEIGGKDAWDDRPGAYAATELKPYLTDIGEDDAGKAIGVITIAGEIVEGEAGPGTAGSDRIAALLDDALNRDLAGLVVRVDSPGGTVTGAEEIRRAILRHKAKGIPIAVSMANVAASGGYWVSTPADRIFAEPETITGSIGIYTVIPTFEGTLASFGVTTDGVRTTPLSGQPDLAAGFTPETEAVLQATVEDGYRRFLSLVSESRKKTPAQIDEIAQGRVWDGGAARQIGLVDQFGGLDNALEWVAGQAELEEGEWHAEYLATSLDPWSAAIASMLGGGEGGQPEARDITAMVGARQEALLSRLAGDLNRLLGTRGAQAYCLECPTQPVPRAEPRGNALTSLLGRLALR